MSQGLPRRGVGKLLMQALIEKAKENGVHVMIAGIESENVASIRLHESLGFRIVGTFSEVGTKFGRWLDLTCMELRVFEVTPRRSGGHSWRFNRRRGSGKRRMAVLRCP